jgi:LacI family transcriptional regulator
MLSIKEVARLTKLSTATVSRALDPRFSHKVKAQTREKILSVCDLANYRPDVAGRSIATGKSYKIGFISGAPASDCGNPIFSCFLKGVIFELQKNNYNLLILGTTPTEENQIINFLRSNVADGYILGNSLVTPSVAEAISLCKAPVLMLENNKIIPNALVVKKNINNAFKEIWENIPKEYYNKILFCSQPVLGDRYNTALKFAPQEANLPLFTLSCGKEFPETRYLSRICALKNLDYLLKYKIFWCSSDLLALGIKDAIEENTNLVAGKDFFLIGFDNMEIKGEYSTLPFMSTVDICYEQMGQEGAKMLLDNLNGKKTSSTIEYNSIYISRQSLPKLNNHTNSNNEETL